jgi:nucleotide-binding universal stress UspA family protein
MIQITRILCPIDFSEFSRHALDHAVAVARWYEARLTVLCVFSNFSAMDMPPAMMDENERQRILKVAAERSVDLIVMGVQGRGALDLLLFGSNTARVSRTATCPVLIVPRA